MATESRTYNPEKHSRIKTEIDATYCDAQKSLDLFLLARRRKIGNESVYYHTFLTLFQSLVERTRMDSAIKNYKVGSGNTTLLLTEIDSWLNNGHKNPKKGIELFRSYCQALFDNEILSIRGQ